MPNAVKRPKTQPAENCVEPAAPSRSEPKRGKRPSAPSLASLADFSGVNPADLNLLEEKTAAVWVPRGTVLMNAGDPPDTLYVVIFGRFYVIRNPGEQPIAEIGPGEPIGEIGFFAGVRRTATVIAARDSKVIRLSRDAFAEVTRHAPGIAPAILTAVAKRLARVTRALPALPPRRPRTIAILPVGADIKLPRNLVADLADAMAPRRAVAVSYDDLREVRMAADRETITRRLLEVENDADVVLFALDRSPSLFTDAALGLAEHLLLVASASDPAMAPTPFESEAAEMFLQSHRTLAVVREKASDEIRGTAAWLAGRDIALHSHLALDSFGDFERLGRFLTGSALGLVLSGGAALGCAHLGVAKALQEAGIPIDYIGGTSVGAAMGAALAMALQPDEIVGLTEEMFVTRRAMRRLTIPVYSLLDHRIFDASLRKNYAGLDVEDLPCNFFAVSANLTTNDLHVHRRGPTWEAVRASAAIPGVLPPFITRSGDVLVDGGIIDNLPVAVMHDLKSGPNIVVGLRRKEKWRVGADYETFPTRRGALGDLLLGRWRKSAYPSLATIIVRGMSMTSERRLGKAAEEGDLFIVPAGTEGVGFLEWEKAREIAEAAYRDVADLLSKAGSLEALLKAGSRVDATPDFGGSLAKAN